MLILNFLNGATTPWLKAGLSTFATVLGFLPRFLLGFLPESLLKATELTGGVRCPIRNPEAAPSRLASLTCTTVLMKASTETGWRKVFVAWSNPSISSALLISDELFPRKVFLLRLARYPPMSSLVA